MKKKSFIIILISVILAAIVLAGIFIALLSTKISQDMQEQYHQEYEVYDFSKEDILIKYFDNADSYSSYDYDEDESSLYYSKSYGSENEISYVITITSDGILSKEAVVSDDDMNRFGAAPTFTKNLTEEQVEALKNEIIKSDIKVILYEEKNKNSDYNYYTFTDVNKYMKIYTNGEVYTAKYKNIEKYTSLNELYEYLLSLLSDEDNKKFEEMVSDYYNIDNFTYEFRTTDAGEFIMYSEELYNTNNIDYKKFIVSVSLYSNRKIYILI